MKYIAHSPTDRYPQGHSLEEHLTKVAQRAADCFTHPFLRDAAYLAGFYHDAGKYKPGVQHHIHHQTKERIDHATLGARLICEKCGKGIYPLLAASMLGHHGGMPDYIEKEGSTRRSVEARLAAAPDEQELEAARIFQQLIENAALPSLNGLPPVTTAETFAMEAYLAARMVHSALVDADYLDTEAYFAPEQSVLRGKAPSFSSLLSAYQTHMDGLQAKNVATISPIRGEILRQCIKAAYGPQGIYTLSVPTGGGKTLASMGLALYHAKTHPNIRRVIYAIPFTTITEQNAAVFRDIFGSQAVLEHHSAAQTPEAGQRSDHAVENWDAPIVVTTNVQLFESIFGNKPSQSRKLHNIQNSVIILDEMQALPDTVLRPCLAALDALAQNYGVTVIICTATQPKYDGIWPKRTKVTEIIEDPQALQEQLRRTYVVHLGALEEFELLARLREHSRVLCIVNNREAAQTLATSLGTEEDGVYHLSTLMCPEHRLEQLKKIRAILADKENPDRPCKVISTSLIEAGVDVDFPVVYRELAGLDSIAQAAGRCNRSGDLPLSPVYVFTATGRRLPKGVQRQAKITLSDIIPLHSENLLSLEAISSYFGIRFGVGNDIDATQTMGRILECQSSLKFPYESIHADFSIIQSGSQPLFIPYNQIAKQLIEELEQGGPSVRIMRALQPYAASVYPRQIEELRAAGRLKEIDGVLVLQVADGHLNHVYSPSYGVKVDAPAQAYFS